MAESAFQGLLQLAEYLLFLFLAIIFMGRNKNKK